jgi:xylose isomerase
MTTGFFGDIAKVKYEGPDSTNPLAFRHYNPDEVVLGKRLEDHLRFAVAYWHTFTWPGGDPFGGQTFERPWFSDTMEAAKMKADVAFEFYQLLGVPYYCFHDADVRPEGRTFAENTKNLNEIVDYFEKKQAETGVKLLWGTANLFSNRRFMSGAATNPDPDVFAFSAATVKTCMDATQRLGGENYVLWGGREGYETLLNTDLKRELSQLGRFLNLVVEYKYKTGFKGTILIEPKPQEPTKHQYDYDVATVYAFLQKNGLENEVKVNIEQGHAILAGHSFEHEIAMANAFGIFGSIDMNRNDYQSGWDTDQFPTTCRKWRWPITTSCRAAASRPAARISTPSCVASHSIRPTCSMAISAAWTAARAASRRRHGCWKTARCRSRWKSATPSGTTPSLSACCAASCRSRRSPRWSRRAT